MITILTEKRLAAIKLELRTEFKEVFEKLERDVDRSIKHWEEKYLYIDKRLSNIQAAQTSITASWGGLKKQVARNSLAIGFKPTPEG